MSIKLKVVTRNMETGEESEKIIDHEDGPDRKWLGRHCFWAFRNNHGVQTYPIAGEDHDKP